MNPHKGGVVAILAQGVGAMGCLLIAGYGTGGIAHVPVGAAQGVMGLHPLVGGTVAVVIVCHHQHDGVGDEQAVGLVHGCSAQQFQVHAVAAGEGHGPLHAVQLHEYPSRVGIDEAVHLCQLARSLIVVVATEQDAHHQHTNKSEFMTICRYHTAKIQQKIFQKPKT